MSIYDAAKDAANVLKEYGKVDEYQKILDLINTLFDKNAEIEELKRINSQLEEKLRVSGNFIFKNNCYWNKDNEDGPFCSRCFDKNKDLIRIISHSANKNWAKCPECENSVNFTGKENVISSPASQFYPTSL